MKISLITNSEKFNELTEFFTSSQRAIDSENYFSWVLTSCADYLNTGDIQFLNNCMVAARMVGRGHVNITRSMLELVAAHTYGKSGLYIGKANKSKLSDNVDDSDKLLTQIEAKAVAYFTEKESKAAEVKTTEDLITDFTALINRRAIKLQESGLSNDQVAAVLRTVAESLEISH